NELQAALLFSLLDVPENGIQIVVEPGSMGVTHPANLVDNWIVHGLDSSNSSGVQMIGALNPLALQTVSITGRIAALAKWRQFHVNKNGIALVVATAMCSASLAAFAGNAPAFSNSFANSSASAVVSSTSMGCSTNSRSW